MKISIVLFLVLSGFVSAHAAPIHYSRSFDSGVTKNMDKRTAGKPVLMDGASAPGHADIYEAGKQLGTTSEQYQPGGQQGDGWLYFNVVSSGGPNTIAFFDLGSALDTANGGFVKVGFSLGKRIKDSKAFNNGTVKIKLYDGLPNVVVADNNLMTINKAGLLAEQTITIDGNGYYNQTYTGSGQSVAKSVKDEVLTFSGLRNTKANLFLVIDFQINKAAEKELDQGLLNDLRVQQVASADVQLERKVVKTAPAPIKEEAASRYDPINITSQRERFVVAKGIDAVPDKQGIVLTHEVILPAFEKGAYYRPYSGGSPRGNRVEAVAFDSINSLQSYKPPVTRKGHTSVQQGQFILLKINEAKYVALLPMVSRDVYCQFFIEKGKMLLKAGSFGTQQVTGDLPLLIWAYGSSPYAATKSVWKIAIDSGHIAADWRSNKPFPEMHEHLGWCSWEFYKTKISEKIITDAVHTVEECGAPIRWVMVDDGYLTHEGRKIINFTPDVKKFPNGWEAITSLKNPEKIRWMGVWRNMLGYMSSISKKHTMTDIADSLVPAARGGCMLPAETPEASTAFFEKMVLDSKESGFDFTKVDFQTRAFDAYKGMNNAVTASRNNNDALEEACKKYNVPLLNCIAQPNVNSLQTKYSVLTRSSPDYNQSDKNKNKCNTYQSFANHLWMGQTVWGDLDMFHTHDERDVHAMAVARAISGGPVYISDEPSKIVPEVLTPFAYADGKLLRTQAPATLLPESFFIHPFRDGKPFRVIAPMEDGVAAIALFNFTEGGKALPVSFSSADYLFAGELLQPAEAWVQPEEGLLVYDRDQKRVVALGDGFTADVDNFGAKLYLLYPKTKGWAVIGRTDKYLPAAAVKVKSVSDKEITFTLKESGPLAVWSEKGAPKMKGAEFKSIGDNLYLAELPIVAGQKEISVSR